MITPRAETNPLPALDMAFKLHPEQIYLLTDGDFPDNLAVLRKIREWEQVRPVKVNTIAFVGPADNDIAFQSLLKEIADKTHGSYKFVRQADLE